MLFGETSAFRRGPLCLKELWLFFYYSQALSCLQYLRYKQSNKGFHLQHKKQSAASTRLTRALFLEKTEPNSRKFCNKLSTSLAQLAYNLALQADRYQARSFASACRVRWIPKVLIPNLSVSYYRKPAGDTFVQCLYLDQSLELSQNGVLVETIPICLRSFKDITFLHHHVSANSLIILSHENLEVQSLVAEMLQTKTR